MPVDLRPFLELRHSPCLAEARAAVMLDARAELQANGFLLLTAEAPAVDAAAPSSTATASATAGAETPSSLLSGSANAAMFEAARQFFVAAESNPAVANAATSLQAAATRGYAAPLSENFASLVGTVGAANDVVSKFRVGPNPELDDLPPWLATPWPPEDAAPNFRETATTTFHKFEDVATACACLLSQVANMPELSAAVPPGQSTSILSLNRYAIDARDLADLRVRGRYCINEHTDVSLFTLLAITPAASAAAATANDETKDGDRNTNSNEEDTDGLECRIVGSSPDSGIGGDGSSADGCAASRESPGEWKKVQPVGGQLVLLIGELGEEWSKGVLTATRHRVALPATATGLARQSAVFFATPPEKAVVVDGMTYAQWRKKRVKRAIKVMKKGASTAASAAASAAGAGAGAGASSSTSTAK